MLNHTRKRKNFLPAFLIALVGWLGLLLVIFYLSPEKQVGPIIFYVFFAIANFFTWSLVIGHTKTGLIITAWLIWLLILSHRQQLTWLTGPVPFLFVILATLFTKKKPLPFVNRLNRVK